MPKVDPRGMAPPLLEAEPTDLLCLSKTVPLQCGFLSAIARRRRAGAATRHANRQSPIAVTGPTDGTRPQLPPAFRARGPGEPRCRHHGGFATPSRTSVFPSPSRFSAAAAPPRPHQPGGAPAGHPSFSLRCGQSCRPGSALAGRPTFRLFPVFRHRRKHAHIVQQRRIWHQLLSLAPDRFR